MLQARRQGTAQMHSERRKKDPWSDVASADIQETRAQRQAGALCHVEHAHGPVINLTVPAGVSLADVLRDLSSVKKERTCDA